LKSTDGARTARVGAVTLTVRPACGRWPATSGVDDDEVIRQNKGSRGGRPVSHDSGPCKDRNTVERLVSKLKAWRGIAARYDKNPGSYLAGPRLCASLVWLKDLPGQHT
jgi:transposase